MRNFFYFCFLLLTCSLIGQENLPLLQTGNRVITKDEFEKRYELSPHLGSTGKKNMQEKEYEFLYSLLAEKLWAQDAERIGLDTAKSIVTTTTAFENMFIRDALYMKEVRNKIQLSNEQLLKAIDRQRKTLEVKYLYDEDSAVVAGYYALLKAGIAFDTVLAGTKYAKGQETAQKIQHGQMAEDIEDSLFNLPLFGYTAPISTPVGFYIFYLKNYQEELLVNVNDPEDAIVKQATFVLKKRLEGHLFQEYFLRFFAGKKVDVKAQLLKSFAVHLAKLLQDKKKTEKIDNATAVSPTAPDYLKMIAGIPADTLQMQIAALDGKYYSLETYILLTAFEGVKIYDVSLKNVFSYLNSKTRSFIETELLAQEGRKQGLLNDPEVRKDVALWRDNYLYNLNRSRFLDSTLVSEAEIKEYYQKNFKELHHPQQVNIIEVLTDSLENVTKILDLVKQGADFRDIADQFNKRSWTRKTRGEYGFFPAFMYGEIGSIAAKMEVGEVFGPIKTKDGYSVIKNIGKKAEYVEYPKQSYEAMKDVIATKLKSSRLKAKIDSYTAKLAREFGFSINQEVFNKISLTEINAFSVRKLGFGGQVSGVPIVAPDDDWIKEYSKTNNPQP